MIGECQKRFSLGRIILVGDRGMVSEETVAEMRARDLDYILGVKLRRGDRVLKALSTPGRSRTLRPDLKVKEATVAGERYIICLNPQEVVDGVELLPERAAQCSFDFRRHGVCSQRVSWPCVLR